MPPSPSLLLVGRDRELEVAFASLGKAAGGTGGVLVLLGDPGIGKTHLARAVLDRATALGMATLWGGCSESDRELPFLVFNEALGVYTSEVGSDTVAAALGPLATALARIVPSVRIPGAAVAAPLATAGTGIATATPTGTADAGAERLARFEAVLAVLRHAAGDRGALIVLDDLQWADSASLELLDFVVRRARSLRLLVLLTCREDVARDHPLTARLRAWRRTDGIQELDLRPFDSAAVADYLCRRFDVPSISESFSRLVWERSNGLPFVVEQIVGDAVDRGDLYLRDGRWRRRPLAEIHLPESVADLLLGRLRQLDPEAVAFAEAAAILGSTFDLELASSVAGFTDVARADHASPTALHAIDALTEGGILAETTAAAMRRGPSDQAHRRFRHAITRDAIVATLSPSHRRRLHERAAVAIEANGAPVPSELARHLLAAGRLDDAVPVCLASASIAEDAGAFVEAARLYQHVVDRTTGPERGRVALRLGDALQTAGLMNEALTALHIAERELRAVDDFNGTAEALAGIGRVRFTSGEPELGRRALDEARNTLVDRGDSAALVLVDARLAGALIIDLHCAAAAAHASEAIAVAGRLPRSRVRDRALVTARVFRAWSRIESGEETAGVGDLDDAVDEAVALDVRDQIGFVLVNAGWARSLVLRPLDIETILAKLTDGEPVTRTFAHFLQAQRARWTGDYALLRAHSEATEELGDELGLEVFQRMGRELLAIGLLEQSSLDDADAILPSLEGAQAQDIREWGPTRLRMLHARGRVGDAVTLAREWLDAAPRLASDPFFAASAIETLLRAGHLDEARAVEAAGSGRPDRSPLATLSAGRIAAAAGATAEARVRLGAAADELMARGCRPLALQARAEGESVGVVGATAPQPMPVDITQNGEPVISRRERELLALLAGGATDQDIATAMFISVSTVRSHLERIRDKTGRRRRPELTRLAIDLGLLA